MRNFVFSVVEELLTHKICSTWRFSLPSGVLKKFSRLGRKMTENFQNILINLNFKPSVTFCDALVVNFVDFLLWNRAQIPFTFDIFEKFLKKLNFEEIKCFRKLKAIKMANETYEKIIRIKELTKLELTSSKSLIIVLGPSVQTAKEAYRITIPSSKSSNAAPTLANELSKLQNVFLQLIQTDDFKDVFENTLPVTNTFVLFQKASRCENNENMLEIRNFKLSKSCKKFSINFTESSDFEVFCDDFENLKVGADIEKDKMEGVWYQLKIFVRGFNDAMVNNKSIWS